MRTEGLLEIDLLTINVKLTLTADPLPRGGVFPYIGYTGMCR